MSESLDRQINITIFEPPRQKAMIERDVAFLLNCFENYAHYYVRGNEIGKNIKSEIKQFLKKRDRMLADDLIRDIENMAHSESVFDPIGSNKMIGRERVIDMVKHNFYA